MSSSVGEFVRKEVPDWDDEVVATARFKVFSGQRPDWEPRFFFWRDLILKVARHLGVFAIRASEVCNFSIREAFLTVSRLYWNLEPRFYWGSPNLGIFFFF